MNPIAIFWPMVAHVFLVCLIYCLLGWRRRNSVVGGTARSSQFKTRGNEPELSATVAANLMNQFELPVLFHVACLAFFATNGVSYVVVTLAWLFVLARYVHAYIHVTSNDLRLRSPAFAVGFLILAIMWLWFALHLLGAV